MLPLYVPPKLVVKSWNVTTEPTDPLGTYVQIFGRREGIIAWILSKVGIDPTVELTIDGAFAHYREASWSGRSLRSIPLGAVSSFTYGYVRPWWAALALGLLLTSLLRQLVAFLVNERIREHAEFFALLVGAAIAFAYYWFNRTLQLDFRHGVASTGLRIKPSVIEGQSIDERTGEKVGNIVQTLLDARRL
jgi:hypothetical protein